MPVGGRRPVVRGVVTRGPSGAHRDTDHGVIDGGLTVAVLAAIGSRAAGAPVKREGGGNIAFTLAGVPVVGDIMSQLLPRSLVAKSLRQSVSNQAIVTDAAIDRYWQLARYPGNRGATRKRFGTARSSFLVARGCAHEAP